MSSTDDARSSSAANQFLQQFMRDREDGTHRTLADYQAMFPVAPEVIAAEYHLLTSNGAPTDIDAAVAYPAQGTRYREAREIGAGGMATVLRVFDPSLERDVAMKRLLCSEGKLPDARSLGRFLEEAKVTGQLQHPGIVSVFEIGLDVERRPYFTMPVIDGRSLHEIITAVHQGDREWSQLRVIDLLVRVCEAVAYAHERGVVHRDLKPSNVMIGQFGETYVVDWGLARVAGRPDRRDIRIRTADPGLDEPDSALRTMEGDVVGTPAYMAPEQARGELAGVGKASDVYSVGAMLYHLLTGTPPHISRGEQPTGRTTLERVLDGPPEAVSSAAPNAAPELIAICELAMNRDASHRYGSVAQLGADLRAFLENRVVRAYTSGSIAELRKWVVRNRGTAMASMAAVLALVVGFVWSEVHRRASDQNARLASANAVLAEQNLDLAFEAGDELLGELGYYGIADEPGSDPVRAALSKKALAYYERFRALRGGDPRVENKVAQALFRIALLQMGFGNSAKARDAWQAARAAIEALMAKSGSTDELRRQMARIEIEENILLLQSGDLEAAVAGLERAKHTLAELLATDPTSRSLRRTMVSVSYNLALATIEQRNKAGALQYSQAALEAAESLAGEGDTSSARSLLGSTQMLRAKLMWQLGDDEKADELYGTAAQTIRSALAIDPGHRGLRYRLGEVLNHHAIVLRRLQRPELAEKLFEDAVAVFRRLVISNPGVRNYHGHFGGALCNAGIMKSLRGDFPTAVPLLEEAILETRRALQIDAQAVDYRQFRVIAGREHAIARLEMGQYQRAAEVVRELMAEQPEGNHYKAGQLLAACANACVEDQDLVVEERDSILRALGDESIAFLREAVKQGEIRDGALEGSAFRSIRVRADFAELLQQVGR